MKTWHYDNGKWTETTFFEDAWQDGESLDALLKRMGFETYTSIGDGRTSAFSLTAYRRDEAPCYLVQYSDTNMWEAITAARLPDAMDLLARYAPIVTASEISDVVSDIRSMEQLGIVTDALASAEVNQQAVASQVIHERQVRDEVRRAARARRAKAT